MPSPIPAPDTPAATAASGGRIQWMDVLRGIAVLLVVVLHGADIPYLNGNGVEEWAQVNRYLEPFRMPLLMFLSGILLPRSLAKPLRLYAWGRVRRHPLAAAAVDPAVRAVHLPRRHREPRLLAQRR